MYYQYFVTVKTTLQRKNIPKLILLQFTFSLLQLKIKTKHKINKLSAPIFQLDKSRKKSSLKDLHLLYRTNLDKIVSKLFV